MLRSLGCVATALLLTPTPLPALLPALAPAAGANGSVLTGAATTLGPTTPGPTTPGPTTPGATAHSSDGVRGVRLVDVPGARAGAASPVGEAGWQVAPGLTYSAWTRTEKQGPVRVHVLTARLDQPGLVLDQVSGTSVTARAPLSRMIRADRAIAGVNGDFFDIYDTGAPLGVGADRQRRVLHAPRSGWNSTFVIDTAATPRILTTRLVARVVPRRGRPVGVTNYNSPVVAGDGVGLYTSAWGRTRGSRVVEGARRVRQVVVHGGVVRSNRTRLSRGALITGQVLVGRGQGATRLRALRVGHRVTIPHTLSVPARVAVSGSAVLLRNRVVTTRDNGQLHPRTAIGIDRDGRLLHLVVVDGRSSGSRGQTMVQLAALLRSLGDEDALNLDGGGSSTLVARDLTGVVGVRNRPSSGAERPVPNGLGFRYTAPRG